MGLNSTIDVMKNLMLLFLITHLVRDFIFSQMKNRSRHFSRIETKLRLINRRINFKIFRQKQVIKPFFFHQPFKPLILSIVK